MWESIATDSCDVCQCPARSKRADDSLLDKENIQPPLSPVKNEDLSFYGCSSPPVPICAGTSPNHCNHNLVIRRPLEDHDPNSRDSGYGTNYNEAGRFSSYISPSRGLSFESASIGSMEDDFFQDIAGIEPLEDNLPQDFNKLISGPISFHNKSKEKSTSPKDLIIRPLFRRALSLQNDRTTPTSSRVRSCLFKIDADRPFKRPDPPQEFESPTNTKKIKVLDEEDGVAAVPSISRPILKRHFSHTEESIMWAVQRSSTEPDLIGDFSKTFCLPLTPGRHQDLKSITSATLARLINGDYSGNIATFKVVDCRYPYEFEGGHIEGAINVYTKEQCMELLTKIDATLSDESNKGRNILVFHCEFSSERGPNLYRYLRKQDRQMNQDAYPSLHYPEVYLLEGGYKNFFDQFSQLCVPIAYKEMLHPEHENDLRYFRLKSRTWNVDTRTRSQCRLNLKKLDL